MEGGQSRTLHITNTAVTWMLLALCYLLREAGGAEKGELLVPITVSRTNLTAVVNGCPLQLDMSVRLPEQLMPLSLTLSEHFSYSHIPVYVNEGAQWVPAPHNDKINLDHPCFYQDLNLDAGFSILFDGDIHKIRGVFHTRTTSYSIKPGPDSSLALGLHSIRTKQSYDSYKTQNRVRERFRRQTKTAYTVELLAVVDFPIFKRWFTLSKAGQVALRDQQATDMIKFYYTHVIHEVDLRYRSIDSSDYTMNVVLSGIYIAKSVTSLPWEEALIEARNGSRSALKASKVLDSMETWVTQFTTNLQYDHIMLFTGYDVYDVNSLGQNIYNKIGSAYLEGICRLRNRISVVEDNSDFTASLTAAHELGHNLGAGHDGNGNVCDSGDQFVMASIVESRTDENIFRFSSCSINAFRSQAIRLSRARSNCLTDEARSYNQTAVDTYLEQAPGQRYNVSHQCKLIYGDGSYFCGGQDNVATICEKLVCHKPSEDACYILGGRPAFRGTSCGNKKWCNDGKCIYDDKAPSLPENCTFGDTLTGVLVSGQLLSCSDVINQHPYLCYEDDLDDLCCGSCGAKRNENKPSCPFGDRTQGCTGLSKQACLGQYNLCCGWCQRYETGIPGCRFGDTRHWCSSLAPHQCYLPDGALCCETCHNYRVNITNCEYGDKITGCNPGLCSESYYKRNCCQTCRDPTTTSTTTTSRTTRSTASSTTSETFLQQAGSSTPTTMATSTRVPNVFTSGAQGVSSAVMTLIVVLCAIVRTFMVEL